MQRKAKDDAACIQIKKTIRKWNNGHSNHGAHLNRLGVASAQGNVSGIPAHCSYIRATKVSCCSTFRKKRLEVVRPPRAPPNTREDPATQKTVRFPKKNSKCFESFPMRG